MNKKKLWIIIGVTLLLLTFVIVAIIRSDDEKLMEVSITSPEYTTVSSEIMVPGTLQLSTQQLITYAPELGTDYEVLVEEGDVVEVGTPIIQYANDHFELEKEQLQISIEAGYLRINQIEKQEEQLKKRKADFAKELGNKEADKAFEAEEQQLWFEKRMANLDLRQILLQQDTLKQREEDLIVKSKIAGTIIEVNENPNLLEMQPTIVHIVDNDQYVVKGNLSEYDSIHIQEGQKVNLSADAIIDETWTGVVEEVSYFPQSSQGFEATSAVQYPITVKLEQGPTNQLRPGLQFIMQIVSEEREALTVPLTAIVRESGDNVVYLVEDGSVTKKQIDLGLVSGESIEIRTGLSKDDKVIVEPSTRLREGMEVSVVD